VKHRLIIVVLILQTDISFGQFNSKNNGYEELFKKPAITNDKGERILPAEFLGGMSKLYKYINSNLRFPKDAKKEGREGIVYVEFIIDKNGKIKDETVNVVNGFLESCDNEAIRLIKDCPDWKPGKNIDTGEGIEMKYTLTINFKKH
jgi:TonB family protein